MTQAEVAQILAESRRHGIDVLDTAISYGESERTMGAVGVEGWRIVGKLPAIAADNFDVFEWARVQTLESLARLGVKQLYGLLLHRPAQLFGSHGNKLYQALSELKAGGLTQKIGISVYDPAELEQILCEYSFDIVQLPLNILDGRMLHTGWLARLKAAGIEVHARSLFLQGLLVMSGESRPNKFNRWSFIWDEWDRWLKASDLTPIEACLRYGYSLPELDKLVIGVDSVQQLREALAVSCEPLNSLPDFPANIEPTLVNPSVWNTI